MEGEVKVRGKHLEVISNALELKESINVKMITRSRMKVLREHHPVRQEKEEEHVN